MLLQLLLIICPQQLHAAAVTTSVTCQPGFEFHDGACHDINECRIPIMSPNGSLESPCRIDNPDTQTPIYCINFIGSYQCLHGYCGFGYRPNPDTDECEDINECSEMSYESACGTRVRTMVCVNTAGGYRCDYKRCPSGLVLDKVTGDCRECPRGHFKDSSGECRDIDECQNPQLNNCPPHTKCFNLNGLYECRDKILCDQGMRANYYGTLCIDKNECAENLAVCNEDEECANTVGSYLCRPKQCGSLKRFNKQTLQCECVMGYRLNVNTHACEDIDECALKQHKCKSDQACRNSRGSHFCIDTVCDPGMSLHVGSNKCMDVNECLQGTYRCGQHEFCFNTHGSYECRCLTGFNRVNGVCVDVNECESPDVCPNSFECVDSVGSFACRCPAGYQRVNDTCKDVDECETNANSDCSPGQCVNTVGSFKCVCPTGFRFASTLAPSCKDINECNLGVCSSAIACHNTPGSYVCICRNGFVDRNGTCVDINECEQANSACPNNECCNYPGSYVCYNKTCPAGMRFDTRMQSAICSGSRSKTRCVLESESSVCVKMHHPHTNESLCVASVEQETGSVGSDIKTPVNLVRMFPLNCSITIQIMYNSGKILPAVESDNSGLHFVQNKQSVFYRCMLKLDRKHFPGIVGLQAQILTMDSSVTHLFIYHLRYID